MRTATKDTSYKFSKDPIENQILTIASKNFGIWDNCVYLIRDPEDKLSFAKERIGKDVSQLLENKELISKQLSKHRYRFRVRLIGESLERLDRLESKLEELGYPKFTWIFNIKEGSSDDFGYKLDRSLELTPLEIIKIAFVPSKEIINRFFQKVEEARDCIPTASLAQLVGISDLLVELSKFDLDTNICRNGYFNLPDLNRLVDKQ